MPVQYITAGIVGYYQSEPWPAFIYPGFKSIYDNGEVITINKPEFEITSPELEESLVIPAFVFFPEIPRSQVLGFIRTHFSDTSQIDELGEEALEWLDELARQFIETDVFDLNIKWKKEFYPKKNLTSGLDSVTVKAVYPIIKRD